jgi:twitching motility protein PilT
MDIKIKKIIETAIANKASDIHLSVGMEPRLRADGELVKLSGFESVDDAEMQSMIFSLLDEGVKNRFLEDKEVDFSLQIDENRFRVNAYLRKGLPSLALRIIPMVIPELTSLNLPEVLYGLTGLKQGFVLVAGPTGQGKSTTVASMLQEVSRNRNVHIVTVEDPIEYILNNDKAIVSQREVGDDTKSFARALRSCLRQDPDVVFVGEMRDLETISTALTVAETGHLVFSTLHTNSASQTIDRIIDVFPEDDKSQVRLQLASVITAVVSQRLLPAEDGGRLPAVEVMIANSAIRNSIRESKTHMIDNIIQTNADLGMMTLEMSLAKWVKLGKISKKTALNYSLRPTELEARLRTKI